MHSICKRTFTSQRLHTEDSSRGLVFIVTLSTEGPQHIQKSGKYFYAHAK